MQTRETLTQLGSKVGIAASPDLAILETFEYKNKEMDKAVIRFSCPEFTSLCPITGQPDFARIYIDYVPDKLGIESKSLKLFLGSFRNHGSFHEECTATIYGRVKDAVKPRWIRVYAVWFPRGGIPIDVFIQNTNPPNTVFIPPLKIYPFEGR